jgi:hypothetical protein
MNFNPQDHVIFECITGSRLYGTNTEGSDVDYRSVCVPPLDVLLDPFMGFEQKDSGFEEDDKVIYALGKFFKLCADSNPNIVELLFIPESNVVSKTMWWDIITSNKNLFLSKKARYTFSGYAVSQLNAIKTHRKYFIDPPREKPTRKAFGLTDSPKASGETLNFLESLNPIFIDREFRDEFHRETEYRKQKRMWDNYVSWRDNRNPERKRLEELYGYDVKHASHLVRLMTEGRELLLTGNITFPLPNAEEVLAIKNGKYEYDEIIDMAETLDNEFDVWYNQSMLPYSADRAALTTLYLSIVMRGPHE